MDELMVFDVKITETIDILCYEGWYKTFYENEDKLCHYFKITPLDKGIIKKISRNNILEYTLYINENNKEIQFYNFDDGDSILFNYSGIEEIDFGHEQIISAKIKYLLDENNRYEKTFLKMNNGINGLITFFNKELGNIDAKIKFYEENNNIKYLYKNIGKKEMVEKILNKIVEIK